jgi:hypothetical protein
MKRWLIVLSIAGLTGCATTAVWQHPARMGGGHDGATMALAECQAFASGTGPAPIPTARMDVPAPNSYTTRGTYSQYGSYGNFNATTTANPGFASNFASGYNSGAAIADAIASIQYQKRIAEVTTACMRTQGWIDTSTPEGQTQFKQGADARMAKTTANQQSDARQKASDEWGAVVKAFLDIEATSPGGIDYRKDPVKYAALDKYVKQLANDPKNNPENMAWFLIEAHKMVLADEKLTPAAGTK